MVNSALTRWLKQGLARGMCPLCRVAQKLDREYVWYFSDEWSSDGATVEAFARARGFCAEHAEQLRLVEVLGLRSTIGISDLYLATAELLVRDLDSLEDDAWLEREPCPACVYRDEGVLKHAFFFVLELRENPGFRADFEQSIGVCVPHFRLLWDTSERHEDRELLRRVQARAATALAGHLREHLRKQRAEYRREAPGPEEDSWQRAIWTTSGWPSTPRAEPIEDESDQAMPAPND